MLSQKLPCLQVFPELEDTIPKSYYIQDYQGNENLQHIHGILAKNKLNAGIIIINVPEVTVREQNIWGDPPIYFVSASGGQQLVQLVRNFEGHRKSFVFL